MCDREGFRDWLYDLPRELNAANNNIARQAWQHQQAKIDALQAQLDHALSDKALAGRWELADKTVNDDGSVTIGNGVDCVECEAGQESQPKPVDERKEFELYYAKKWQAELPVEKNHTIEFLCSELKEVRQGDGYCKDMDCLDYQWKGWQARAALNKGA